ncbi:hypothetical protein EYR36_010006 [Pleurotus pulmonarius]|nr:hypothetical protein EYR36_010006 [Pleurotus pulmonarius]KAF4593483.1 hypothetical protein EYR38_009198 [Pleurotus pulmonarius]
MRHTETPYTCSPTKTIISLFHSPPLLPIATPPRTEAPLITELDDLQDRRLAGISSIPGSPAFPAVRCDLHLDGPDDPHRAASSSPPRSISPLRLSPYLGTAAPDTRAVSKELGQDSQAPPSSSLPSPQLSPLLPTANLSPPLYSEAEYTLQHLQRVEAELRETREALEADEAERVALQGVLDGLVQGVVGAGYGILGADGGGGGVGEAQE